MPFIISTYGIHYNYILATNKKIHINVNKWPEVGICQGSAHSFRGRGKTYQSNDFVCLISCPNCCPCSVRPGVSPLLSENVVF